MWAAVNSAKNRGNRAEREVAKRFSDELGVTVKRRYNLGTHEDIGDIALDDLCVQVVDYQDIVRAIREKVPECEQQQARGSKPFGATFVRRRGGAFVVVMSEAQFFSLYREVIA